MKPLFNKNYLTTSRIIGIWVGKIQYNPEIGGGFTFIDSIIQELEATKDIPFETIIFYSGHSPKLKNQNIKWIEVNQTLLRRILCKIDRFLISLNIPSIFMSVLEKECIKNKVSLLWISFPDYINIQKIPYIYTLWDLGHKTTPFFPEVLENGEHEQRDSTYRYMLSRAMRIITGNSQGKKEILHHFKIESDLIKEIPFAVSEFNDFPEEVNKIASLCEKYIFYPAQFWPHKNHITALKTIKWLKEEKNINIHLVLSGADKGNLEYVKFVAKELQIEEFIHFVGFVKRSELHWLYKHALALTYFSTMGPNNIPPIEALSLNCPVILSDLPGHREQLGDEATYAKVYDYQDWGSKIISLLNVNKNNSSQEELNNNYRLSTYKNYIESLVEVIKECIVIRDLWQ